MAFDVIVGKSPCQEDNPVILGSIEFENDYKALTSLHKKYTCERLGHFVNLFEDCSFGPMEIVEAKAQLVPLLPLSQGEEQIMLCKLVAWFEYADTNGLSLFGLSD